MRAFFALALLLFGLHAQACKPSKDSSWKLDQAQLTAKAKTIYVVRILARVNGRERTAYRAEVVRTLKGARVDQLSFDMILPKKKFPNDKYAFEMGEDCQPRGSFVTDNLYLLYPESQQNLHAIVPLKSINDPEIDKVEALVKGQG